MNSSTIEPLLETSSSDLWTTAANQTSATDYQYYELNCLQKFRLFYLPFHGPLSLVVCLFGLIANALNIIVLTRKEMVSPTNAILTGLAVADMLVMVEYMPFSVHNYVRMDQNVTQLYSYEWTVFTLFHAHFSVVCHTISTWLTVLLAVWRLLVVSYPTECKTWCTMQNAALAITCTYLIVPICCTPVYLSFTIVPMTLEDNSMNVNYSSIFRVDWSDIALQNGELLKKINFWVFSVATKLVPCMLLTYLSLALIRVLVEADKRKQRLHQNKTVLPDARSVHDAVSTHDKMQNDCNKQSIKKHSTQEHNSHVCVQSSSSQSSDRTTRMLLAVLLLFLITEFPSGILVLISGIIGERFHREYYSPLGELLDMLALVNSAINFILYCSMSRLFRKTFTKLFCTASWSDERYERENETVHVAIANLDKKRTKIMTATGSGQEPKTKATYV